MLNPLDWIKSYALAIVAILALAGWVAFGLAQYRYRGLQLANATALNKATAHAKEIEDNWKSDAEVADEVQREQLDKVNTAHLSDLDRVRRYYANLPKPAASANASTCTSSIPQQTVERAVALESDADSLRADYARCLGWVKSVTSAGKNIPHTARP